MVGRLSKIECFWEDDIMIRKSELDITFIDGENATKTRRLEFVEDDTHVWKYLLEEI